MLKITVEGNKEEIKKAKQGLDTICFFNENCKHIDCRDCEKVKIKYVAKENK